jgi:hypothetical protein
MDELYGFLEQSNISRKNIVRLESLAQHVNNDVRHLAMLILEVARVKPQQTAPMEVPGAQPLWPLLTLKGIVG